MKRKITAILFAFIAMISALLAFSCSNFDGKSEENEQRDSAYISLKVDGDVRTARPDYELSEFTKFELLGKLGDAEEKSLKTWSANQETEETAYALMAGDHLQIAVGSWIFRLRATAAGDVIYEGSDTVQVESGDNTIDFTLDLAELPSTGTGGISVKVVVTQPGDLSLVVAELYKNGETPELVGTMQIENKGTVEFSDLNVGSYTIDFSFYADEDKKILLGKCPENAIVVPGKTSSSLLTLDSLDSTYTITYHLGEELSQTAKYTRHAKVVLPDSSAELTQKEGFVFCGWYASEDDAALDSSASAVTEIPVNTVGNKNYWPRFISVADTAQIKTVAVEGTLKVSKTVKAVPYTKETDFTEDDKFTGEITSYKWYVGEDSNGDDTIDEWSEVAGKTDSEYAIGPEDLGKTLRVEIVQKYYAVEDTEKNIYTVIKDNAAVSSSTEKNPVAKGTLPDGIIKAEYSETITVGNTPFVEKVVVKDYDDEPLNPGDAPGKYTAEIQNNEALASSKTISVKITLYGFEDVIMQVFVSVKAAQPSASLRTDTVNIDDNKVAFVTPLPSGAEYSTDGGENWTDIAATPFTPLAENGKILVRTKASGTAGEEGYIAESDSIEISVTNENLGTKIEAIATVALTGEAKVGNTLSATVTGEKETNLTESENVTYQWYAASGADTEDGNAINGATGKAFTLTPAEAGKFIYVKATQTNPKTQAAQAVSSTRTGPVANGALNAAELTVSYDGFVFAGNAPSAEKLAVSGKLTGGANTVEISQSAQAGDGGYTLSVPGTALTASCYVTVTISAAGYNAVEKQVFVTVKAKTPVESEVPALSTAVAGITVDKLKFTPTEAQSGKFEYSTDGTESESGTTWTTLTGDEFEKPGEGKILQVRVKATAGENDVNENPVGFIAASEPYTVSYGDSNVGTKTTANITVELSPNSDIVVSSSESGGTITLSVENAEVYSGFNWENEADIFGLLNCPITIGTPNASSTTLAIAPDAAKGKYGIVVSAMKGGITYSTTVYVVVGQD